jgi:hypothetical protein
MDLLKYTVFRNSDLFRVFYPASLRHAKLKEILFNSVRDLNINQQNAINGVSAFTVMCTSFRNHGSFRQAWVIDMIVFRLSPGDSVPKRCF